MVEMSCTIPPGSGTSERDDPSLDCAKPGQGGPALTSTLVTLEVARPMVDESSCRNQIESWSQTRSVPACLAPEGAIVILTVEPTGGTGCWPAGPEAAD